MQVSQSVAQCRSDPEKRYWYQVDLVYTQLDGLYDGYLNTTTGSLCIIACQAIRVTGPLTLTFEQVMWLSTYWEFDDLVSVCQCECSACNDINRSTAVC
jgi:hypothetical protein